MPSAACGALPNMIPGSAGIGSILYWEKLEEAALGSRFGADYDRYRKGTWF